MERKIMENKNKGDFLNAKAVSAAYKGKEIFKPMNTGWIDKHVAVIREYGGNLFFYKKNDKVIMIDGGYPYPRLKEKMKWVGISPKEIEHILITHQDIDHVGAFIKQDNPLFSHAKIYISEMENQYLTGEKVRRIYEGTKEIPTYEIENEKVLLKPNQILEIEGIKIECFPVIGHTWGHFCYLIDDKYIFTGDTLWFGPDGGYSFLDMLAENNEMGIKSIKELGEILKNREIKPLVITGHTGYYDDLEWAFRHTDKACDPSKKQEPHDPNAPYDPYEELGDTEENSKGGFLPKVIPVI